MFEPLFNASLQIQLHVTAALVFILLGPFALYRTRRDRLHKTLGYIRDRNGSPLVKEILPISIKSLSQQQSKLERTAQCLCCKLKISSLIAGLNMP